MCRLFVKHSRGIDVATGYADRFAKKHGLSIADIAERLRVSRVAAYNWRTGKTQPRPYMALKLRRMWEEYEARPPKDRQASYAAVIDSAKQYIAQSLGIDPGDITIAIDQ